MWHHSRNISVSNLRVKLLRIYELVSFYLRCTPISYSIYIGDRSVTFAPSRFPVLTSGDEDLQHTAIENMKIASVIQLLNKRDALNV